MCQLFHSALEHAKLNPPKRLSGCLFQARLKTHQRPARNHNAIDCACAPKISLPTQNLSLFRHFGFSVWMCSAHHGNGALPYAGLQGTQPECIDEQYAEHNQPDNASAAKSTGYMAAEPAERHKPSA